MNNDDVVLQEYVDSYANYSESESEPEVMDIALEYVERRLDQVRAQLILIRNS